MCSSDDDDDYVESNPYEDEMIKQADSMWKDYQQHYVPLENELMDRTAGYKSAAYKQSITNKAANAARMASPGTVLAGAGMNPANGNFLQTAHTAENQTGMAAGMGAMSGLQTAADQYTGGTMNLSQIGRQQQGTSMAGYGNLASLEAGQVAAKRAAKQTVTNARMGALGSVAGAATAYGMKSAKPALETATNIKWSSEPSSALNPHAAQPSPFKQSPWD